MQTHKGYVFGDRERGSNVIGVGSSHDRKHPQPLPSVIPTINLRTLNVAPMMGVASQTWEHARVWLPPGAMNSSRT